MRKLIAEWGNGIKKEIEVTSETDEIIQVAELKEWCDKNGFAYPEFSFEGEFETEKHVKYDVCIYSGQGYEEVLATFDTEGEAFEFCNSYGWEYKDGNEFVWSMKIEEAPGKNGIDERIGQAEESLNKETSKREVQVKETVR